MEKTMSAREAWLDFYAWIRAQNAWREMEWPDRRRIYDANADFKERRGQKLGSERIKDILSTFAPGRYEFREVVILHDEHVVMPKDLP